PAPLLQQPLQVLPAGYQEGFTVDSPQPAQAEPPHAMPLLAFSEKWLNPHLALAQRFLIGGGLLVAAHTLLHRPVEGAMADAALRPGCTGLFHRTGIAGGGVSPVLGLLRLVLATIRAQDLPLRTAIDILLGIVGKLGRAIVVGVPVPLIKQRHVSTDAHG